MKKFLEHLLVAIRLYKLGYSFSRNDHAKGKWGFYRFNFEKGNRQEYAIVDIDFSKEKYSHVHRGNKTLHRWDFE